MRTLTTLTLLAGLTPLLPAQISDIQAGRNFPVSATAFGTGRSENVDVGDIDNDGDYDVLVANGGDGGAQANVMYGNNGNLQGGTPGTFTNITATALAGAPLDTSRDCEFADFDNDCDLDIYISNRGSTVNGGEVSRAFINQGGAQLGLIARFLEGTNTFWGSLTSVPAGDQVFGGNAGPFRDFSCDCDFADLDDDGDLDLFHSSYGPNIDGTRDSRIFLNDGGGVFDEMWPWINAGADIQTHTLDIDLVDFDGDLDHDVLNSSRDSQARIFRNNREVNGWTSGDKFTDVTQTALLDTGAGLQGGANYEAEYGDIDGDGDFDCYMKNYGAGVTDVTLRNDGNLTFTVANWIRGDANVDENEIDFLDYDNDGDLDAFLANFSGTNWLYQNAINDGTPEAQGWLHRTGTNSGGSQATWDELPASGNGSTTLDGECADMDGDGDTDILVANDGNGQNRLMLNTLASPDTHAPTFQFRTVQGNKSGDSETVLHVQVRDNANYYVIDYYDADIYYSVDGGDEACVQMFAQRGQQFRGVIPAIEGTISYRFECTDDAGNTGVSPTEVYTQSGVSAAPVWQNIGCGTEGVNGQPYLQLSGAQTGGSTVTLTLKDAAPNSLFLLWISLSSSPGNAVGGTVYAVPFSDEFLLPTDAGGMFRASTVWPIGVPSGTPAWWQGIVGDGTSLFGITLSNAVQSTAP